MKQWVDFLYCSPPNEATNSVYSLFFSYWAYGNEAVRICCTDSRKHSRWNRHWTLAFLSQHLSCRSETIPANVDSQGKHRGPLSLSLSKSKCSRCKMHWWFRSCLLLQAGCIQRVMVPETLHLHTRHPPKHFLIGQETGSFTCKCQNLNHWRLDNYFKFLVFVVSRWGTEPRRQDHVSVKDRRIEAEIKWVLSTLSASRMFWIAGIRWVFNWHIPLYEPRIIGIWLAAFVIHHVNYSWEKYYRSVWDCNKPNHQPVEQRWQADT